MNLTKATKSGYKIGDSYARLLERFPLWKLRNEDHYESATAVLQDLMGRGDLDTDESAYLDALTILVGEYENRKHSLDELAAERTALDTLKHLMDANEMKQTELAKLIGVGASAASMIISGARPITADHARKLGKHFGIDPGIFI